VRSSSPDGQESIPANLGRYEVILPVAAGGMATVYLAQSRGTGGFERFVAIKLTHPHLEGIEGDFMADLLEEAKLAVRIRHPNIVPTLDVGESGKSLFLVMDYIEGDSLSGLIRRARKAGRELPLGMTMRILCDALAGLHAAHELKDDDGRGLEVVHRDVSPQNILVGTDGMARLADFGIARTSSRLSQTRPGAVKGKVAYMPPEQVQGGVLDRRCDVWAAGVIAWELLARRRLFDNADDFAVALQLVMDPLPEMRAVNPNVPPALELVISQALHKEKMARTPSAAAFRAGLIEACKTSGITLFEHDEVGAIVEELTRASLNERMRQAKAILAARKPVIVGAPPTSQPGQFALVHGPIPAAPGSTPGELIRSETTQPTDTSAVRDYEPKRKHDRRLVLVAGAMAAGIFTGALALFATAFRAKPAASPEAESSVSAAAESLPAQNTAAPRIEARPASDSSLPTAVPTSASSSAPTAAPAPTATSIAATSASAAPKGAPSAKKPKGGPGASLATNPYGGKR
jgi:serine/threonine protein kinase